MTLENIEQLSDSDIDRGGFLKGLGLGALSLAGLPAALSSIDSALAASGGEIDNFTWFGGSRWEEYRRRNMRTYSSTSREVLSALRITHVLKHNDGSESGFTTTPSA